MIIYFMKGVTPVIAVILLLLITVSLVGFAAYFLQKVQTTAAADLENQLSHQDRERNAGVKILSVYTGGSGNIIAKIRNTGRVTINSNELVLTVSPASGAPQTATNPSSISPGQIIDLGSSQTCSAAGNPYTIRIDALTALDARTHNC